MPVARMAVRLNLRAAFAAFAKSALGAGNAQVLRTARTPTTIAATTTYAGMEIARLAHPVPGTLTAPRACTA